MRQAIAIWPTGECVTNQPEGIKTLRARFADCVADGNQPAGTSFFRLPRRLEVVSFRVPGTGDSRFDRFCPVCYAGHRFHLQGEHDVELQS